MTCHHLWSTRVKYRIYVKPIICIVRYRQHVKLSGVLVTRVDWWLGFCIDCYFGFFSVPRGLRSAEHCESIEILGQTNKTLKVNQVERTKLNGAIAPTNIYKGSLSWYFRSKTIHNTRLSVKLYLKKKIDSFCLLDITFTILKTHSQRRRRNIRLTRTNVDTLKH